MCALERVSQSFPSPSDSPLLPPPPPLHPIARFPPPARPGRLSTSLSFTLELLSLLSHPRFHLSPAFSPLSTPPPPSPRPSFSFSPIRRDGGNRARYTHVLSRTCGFKVFARDGQYSPTTRTIPTHPGGGGERGARGRRRRYRFYPAAVAETFFPYLGITSKLE